MGVHQIELLVAHELQQCSERAHIGSWNDRTTHCHRIYCDPCGMDVIDKVVVAIGNITPGWACKRNSKPSLVNMRNKGLQMARNAGRCRLDNLKYAHMYTTAHRRAPELWRHYSITPSGSRL